MNTKILFVGMFLIGCHGGGKHHQGNANEYMNKNSFEDLVKSFESAERDAYQQPEKVLDYLGSLDGKTIEDIGTGSGYFTVRLANRGAHVIAADVDDRFLEYVRQRLVTDSLNTGQVELRKIPYDDCGLKPGEADKVLIVDTYHHIENRVEYFRKLKTGLKPGGELIIIDFFKKEMPVGPPVDHKIGEDVVVEELKSAGFKILETNTTLLPNQYIIKAQ